MKDMEKTAAENELAFKLSFHEIGGKILSTGQVGSFQNSYIKERDDYGELTDHDDHLRTIGGIKQPYVVFHLLSR